LDYLASELIDSGWSLKHLHRLIMQSAAYQQGRALSRTRHDEWLFRGRQLRRLEAEVIRDQMLALSERFDRRMYGAGTLNEDQPCRSIYFRVKRSRLIPSMMLFDAPDALQGIGERPTTTVAPQALALMNARHVEELAAGFARRLSAIISSESRQDLRQPSKTETLGEFRYPKIIRHAYREALGRLPNREELSDALAFVQETTREYKTRRMKLVVSPVEKKSAVVWLDASSLPSGPVAKWASSTSSRLAFQQAAKKAPIATNGLLKFGSGTTFLRADNHSSLNFGTGDFSITLMFRMTAETNLLGKDSFSGSGNSYTGYFLQVMNDRLRFATRDLRSGKGPVNYLDSEPVIKKNVWHRITAVRSSGTLRLYINDATEIHKSMQERIPTNVDAPTGLKIGEMDDHDSGSFQGDIAEVLIYNRALSTYEVRDNHLYLGQKHLGSQVRTPFEDAMTDFCQALFCLNEFIYVE